jgi:cytosine/adenosine deaminase-related metal-dependent hydrolase
VPDICTIRARWLFPVVAPPVAGGTLTFTEGRIVAVDPAGQRTPDLDLGNVAVLPGLVNAHTHLDLGELRGRLAPPTDFTAWLKEIVAYRRGSAPAAWEAAIHAGIEECLLSGTTLVGDISTGGHSAAILANSPVRAVVFFELIGLTKARARQVWNEAQVWLRGQPATATYRPGLSPHAPYSVRRALFRLAARQGVPLAIHLAETLSEDELLRTHRGPFREYLEALGAWDERGLAASLNWIIGEQRRAERVLYIHGNYADRIGVMREQSGQPVSVVYCARTHAYFGHPPHPFMELLAAGVNVALGTDSLASNPDLSILEEMRFLWRRYPTLGGETLLRMGTLAGARALGWEQETGSLAVGKSADWVTIPLEDEEQADPYRLLFAARQGVCDVWVRGEQVVGAGKIMTKPGSLRAGLGG